MVNDDNERIKLTINEPIDGSFKSQIQEFIDYHRGPGVQHIAFGTQDICESIIQLKDRGKGYQWLKWGWFWHLLLGVQFLETPYTYYQKLEQRLQADKVNISKDISLLHKHNILVDYDHTGHLYQIFTRPIQDRPTVFLELIERHHFGGFGAGNIKALFESIEEEQKLRGNVWVAPDVEKNEHSSFLTTFLVLHLSPQIINLSTFVYNLTVTINRWLMTEPGLANLHQLKPLEGSV